MSSTMPDWPKLWAKEPALRPRWPANSMNAREVTLSFRPQDEYVPIGCDTVWCVPHVTAALCRDAAVRWLESQFEGAGIIAWSTRKGWSIGYHEGYSDFKDLGEGATKDEALFNACKFVIDSRERTNANP